MFWDMLLIRHVVNRVWVCLVSARPLSFPVFCIAPLPLPLPHSSSAIPPKQTHPIPYPLLCPPKFSHCFRPENVRQMSPAIAVRRQQLEQLSGNDYGYGYGYDYGSPEFGTVARYIAKGLAGHIFHLSRPEPEPLSSS